VKIGQLRALAQRELLQGDLPVALAAEEPDAGPEQHEREVNDTRATSARQTRKPTRIESSGQAM